MSDFEVMPVGTRAAMKETALLLRQYEREHLSKAKALEDTNGGTSHGSRAKAERNAIAAERLETLLKVPGVEGATVTVPEPHADLPK